MGALKIFDCLSAWAVSLIIFLFSAVAWYALVPMSYVLLYNSHYVMLVVTCLAAYGRRYRKATRTITKQPHSCNSYLDSINVDYSIIHTLASSQLSSLADEIRASMIRSVAETGGHLGSSLGVVELTVAIHNVFNLPTDKLIWDVGHQVYPHKMLTGRLDKMHTLRKGGGLSGFTNRSESAFDSFGAGHACTAVSAAVGFAIARDLAGESHFIVSVIGDGSLTGGMSFEALNHAGHLNLEKFIVILNDNGQISLPTTDPIGGISRSLKSGSGREFFESLGFDYLGPVDGHNLQILLEILSRARTRRCVLIHVKTVKGKGYHPAEKASDCLHGVGLFDVETGKSLSSPGNLSFTEIFSAALCKAARDDPRIVAVTAAMPGGTGLTEFAREFGISRMIDVGICEQHAVTCAAGMASSGLTPFVAIYSTFLQRGFDSLIHDVALQNLSVRFILDRSGFVGADGPTHQGMFDVAYLRCIPNIKLCAPADAADLSALVDFLVNVEGPVALRYPRGVAPASFGAVGLISKGRVVRDEGFGDRRVVLLSYGAVLGLCLEAADVFKVHARVCVVDARWCKPLDEELILQVAAAADLCVTVEEGSCGGFSGAVMELLVSRGLLGGGSKLKVESVFASDSFIEHDSQSNQLKRAGISVERIVSLASG